MADGVGKYIEELWVGIKADYSSLQAGLKQAQMEIKGFVNHLGSSSAQMQKFGMTTTLVAGAFAGFGAIIVNTFAKFEQSMANAFSVLGATKKEMEDMEATARKFGQTSVFSASQAADAMYYLASAGFTAQQTMAALGGILKLAAATQYDLAQTTEIVVAALNAYQLDATESTRVSNTFAAAIGYTQATMERIGDSFKYVGTAAAQLGIPLEQITAALGMLYNAGLAASQAGTALRTGLVRLQKPTDEAKKAILSMGLTLDDVNPQLHSLTEIVKAFEQAGGGLADKGDELAAIFDVRAAGAFQVLIRQGADALDIMETKITGTSKASEMAELQINTFQGAMKLLKGSLQEAAIQIGESLQPVLRALQFTIMNVVRGFNALPMPLKAAISGTVALAVGLGLVVGPIALLIAKIPALIAQVKLLGASFAISMGWVFAISAAVIALVAVIGILANAREKEKNILTDSITQLKEYNERQIQTKTKMIDVITAYTKLAEKQDQTTKGIDAQKSAFDKIKVLYPSLISSTDTYSTSLSKMKGITQDATLAVAELYKQKLQLAKLELRIDISKAKTDLSDIQTDIADSRSSLGEWFSDTGLHMDRTINTAKILSNTFKSLSLRSYKDPFLGEVTSTESIKQSLQTILATTDGINKIQTDGENLTNNITELESKRNDLLMKQRENGGKLNDTEETRLEKLKNAIPEMKILSGLYTEVSNMGKKQDEYATSILEKTQELEELKKNGLAPPPKITPDIVTPSDFDPDDEARKKAQELEREIYELKKKSMELQLGLLEKHRDDSIIADMKYLDKKYEIEQADLDFYVSTQKQKLVELKSNQAELSKVDQFGVDTKKANEEKYQFDKKDIEDKWFKKSLATKENEFKYIKELNVQDVQNWKQTLEAKQLELEKAGKIFTDEWKTVIDAINATNQLMTAPQINKIKYEMELYNQGEDKYGKALDDYYNYLQAQLGLYQTWNDDYLNIALKMEDVKKQIIDRELDSNRFLFWSIRDMAYATTDSIWAGWNTMWDKYVVGAREAKNDLDAVWIAMKTSFLKAVMEMLEAEVTKLLIKFIGSFFGPIGNFVAGLFSGGMASAAPASPMPSGTTGAQVMKSGQMVVHKDEVIVPAKITRKSDERYKEASQQSEKQVNGGTIYNMNLVLNNPSVDDKRYWEGVAEKHITPAMVKIKKRFESI